MPGWDGLRTWAREVAELELSAEQTAALRTYVDLLLLWNRKVALVSQQNLDEILAKHVADSLFAAAHCRGARAVADLGSGGGFPGVVIGVIWPDTRVCLMESRGKKASFLEEVCRVLRLRAVTVYHGRIESAADEDTHRHAFDVAVSRALADLDALERLAMPLLSRTGRLIAMRSTTGAIGRFQGVDYRLPDGSPRRLAIARPPDGPSRGS